MFDETTGYFGFEISKHDFDEFTSRFTENGVKQIRFKVVAKAPGSSADGAATAGNISTEFTLKFLEDTVADDCANNKLLYGETDNNKAVRTYESLYEVKDFGETAETKTIPGIAVRSSIADCPFKTVFEYQDRQGNFVELLEQPGSLDLSLTADNTSLDITIDQDFFLDSLYSEFGDEYGTGDRLYLIGRFRHTDPISGDSFEDYVELIV
jgi:hypothetical protein